MSKAAIVLPKLAPPVGRFSQAICADGYVFCSRQVAQDPAAGKLLVELLRGPQGAPRTIGSGAFERLGGAAAAAQRHADGR